MRLAGLLGMGLYAFAVVGAATDRVSGQKVLWEMVVPNVLADGAWRARAAIALHGGDAPAALAAATAAVDSAPIEPASADLLGSAQLLAHRPGSARRAFEVAGQMGWRQAATQTFWMNQALARGDFGAAAMRLDALVRQTPALAADAALLEPFEGSAAARLALQARLAAGPPWTGAYVGGISNLGTAQLQARGAVMRGLARAGQRLGCQQVGPLVSALATGGQPAEAAAIWSSHCPDEGAGLIGDGSFARLDLTRRNSAFSWWAPADSDVSTSVDDQAAPGQPRLVVNSSASFPREVLTRMVYLPAGAYRLSWQALSPAGQGSDRIEAVLSCRPGSGEPLPGLLAPHSGRTSALVQAHPECLAPWLSFRLRPGVETLHFGNVRMEPAR